MPLSQYIRQRILKSLELRVRLVQRKRSLSLKKKGKTTLIGEEQTLWTLRNGPLKELWVGVAENLHCRNNSILSV